MASPTGGYLFNILFNEQSGAGQASFPAPAAQQVSIWVRPIASQGAAGPYTNYAYIQAFDTGGNLVASGKFTPTQSELGHWYQVTATSASQNIASVKFSTTAGPGFPILSAYDDFCFAPNLATVNTPFGNFPTGCAPPPVPPTVVNFDKDPAGNTIAGNSLISSTYSSLGVTLGCFNGTSQNLCYGNDSNKVGAGDAFALYFAPEAPAHSPPNGATIGRPVSPEPGINDQEGYLQASFSTPQQEVSIWVYPIFGGSIRKPFTNYGYINAYDPNNHLVGQGTFTPVGATSIDGIK